MVCVLSPAVPTELQAYAGLVSAVRARGNLTPQHQQVLNRATELLNISPARAHAEMSRAMGDERLDLQTYTTLPTALQDLANDQ